jgi:hypothetical protein
VLAVEVSRAGGVNDAGVETLAGEELRGADVMLERPVTIWSRAALPARLALSLGGVGDGL